MKRSITLLLVLALMVFITTACFNSTAPSNGAQENNQNTQSNGPKKVKELKLGHNVSEDNTWHLGAEKFAEAVEELSGGSMKIVVYPNAQLGDEMDVIRSVQQGTCDFTISGGALQSWAPLAAMVECPYTFSDSEHLAKIANGKIGEEIAQQIIDKAFIRPLTYFERGPRKLTANKPIKHPKDLKGLIIRVPNSPLYVAAWESLGAKPTPMAFSEVFTALQHGTIHAQENPLAMINSSSVYEVQKYIMNTDHLIAYTYLAIGEKQYQKLTDEEKEIIHEAAQIAQDYEHRLFLEDEKKLADKMIKEGLEFIDVDYEAFQKLAVEGVKKALTNEQSDIYERIIKAR